MKLTFKEKITTGESKTFITEGVVWKSHNQKYVYETQSDSFRGFYDLRCLIENENDKGRVRINLLTHLQMEEHMKYYVNASKNKKLFFVSYADLDEDVFIFFDFTTGGVTLSIETATSPSNITQFELWLDMLAELPRKAVCEKCTCKKKYERINICWADRIYASL